MLVEQRMCWRKQFEECALLENNATLNEYKANRLSNSWRMTASQEMLCEYVLYLEDRVQELLYK